jgi:hypothetical protein
MRFISCLNNLTVELVKAISYKEFSRSRLFINLPHILRNEPGRNEPGDGPWELIENAKEEIQKQVLLELRRPFLGWKSLL